MWIPGFGSDEIRPYKKACTTEAHKQVSLHVLRLIQKYRTQTYTEGKMVIFYSITVFVLSANGTDPQDDQKVARLRRPRNFSLVIAFFGFGNGVSVCYLWNNHPIPIISWVANIV